MDEQIRSRAYSDINFVLFCYVLFFTYFLSKGPIRVQGNQVSPAATLSIPSVFTLLIINKGLT